MGWGRKVLRKVDDVVLQPITQPIKKVVEPVVDFVLDEIVEPVVNVVGNVIDSALDDPIKAIATITAYVYAPWAIPLIEGADIAIAGGDLNDVLEATAKAYVAKEIGSAVGSKVSNSIYGAQAGVQAGVQTANEAIAAEVIGRATGNAATAVVLDRDPLQAFITGGVSAGVPAVLGQVDGFTDLPQSAQRAISYAVTAKALGRDIDETAIAGMVLATELTTRTLNAYDPDKTKLTDAERALAADVLYATTSTAVQGGDVSAAIQAQLVKAGVKELGDMAKAGFKDVLTKLQGTFEATDANGMLITKNEAEQKAILDAYNTAKAGLDEKIVEQDRLKTIAEEKVAIAKQDLSNKANADAANAAIKEYDDYAKTVGDAYNELKPTLDGYSEDLSALQVTHAELTDDYEGLIKSLAESTSPVQDKLDDIYFNTNEAFVGALDPTFDAAAYKKINNLGDDVDVYEHWLDKGQLEGLVTNDKDQKIVEARAKYKEATGQDLPERIVERARVTDIDNRDSIVENFVDTTLADSAAVQATTNKAVEQVLAAYNAAGLSETEVKEKIDNGEAVARADQIVAEQKQSVENLRDYAAAVAQEKGTDSAEFKAAYKDALEAMADVGGYGVSKDGDDFVTAGGGKLDLATNTEQFARPTARIDAAVDPVTGEVVFGDIRYGNEAGKLTGAAYSAVLAIGESANPPKEGGGAYFGDGTGVSSGLFGGFSPIAFDDGSGNSGMLYQGDSGFSLITYSDGRSVVVKDTVLATPIDEKGEPPPGTIWAPDIVSVPPEVKEKILAEVPVVKEKTPEEKEALKAKLNEPPPATIADAKETIAKATSEALGAAYQTPEEVTAALKAAGYTATPEEAASMRGEKSVEQLAQEVQAYADPRVVDEGEAKAAYEALGLKRPTADDIKSLMGQYEETGLTEKAKANLDNARYNSIVAQLDDLAANASANQETLDAIALVKSDLATQVTDLGFKVDTTKTELGGQITGLSTDVQTKYDALTNSQKALADQLTQQGVDLNTAVDTAKTEFTTALGETETRVTGEIQGVADLVGKPASEVTQGDIDYVKQFLAGGTGQGDLTYDYNGDGVVDASDQTALEGIVGGTGEGSPFAPAAGSKWAATGIYGTLAENQAAAQKAIAAEAEATRATNARIAAANRNAATQQAQQTRRMGNVNSLMNMLGQANDISGQQVTVKPADPAKIGYVYDFDSIFANPTQEKMFGSPYGNYAQGGMVEDDVNAELIKMLRS